MNKILAFALAAFLTTCSAMAKDQQVKSYTKKNGTVVAAHTRQVKDKVANTTTVKSYTRKDGTVVKGYTKTKSTKPAK